jgi:hypothetical protein
VPIDLWILLAKFTMIMQAIGQLEAGKKNPISCHLVTILGSNYTPQ